MPTAVTRTTPQSLLSEEISHATTGELAALFGSLLPFGWRSNSQTDAAYPGGLRLVIESPVRPAQFAYIGDQILVIDATYDGTGWHVSAATDVIVYSAVSAGPSLDDFTNAFAPVTG